MPRGFNVTSDILTRTRDGQDLNAIWDTYQNMLAEFNSTRQPLIDLLSFTVTEVIEDIVQPGQESFEQATELGKPVAMRPQPIITQRAYPFKWYDTRAAYTFQFLMGGPNNTAGATQAQLDAIINQVMEADNNLQFQLVMKALFNSANRTADVNGTPYTVTALYNADGAFIPTYKGQTFAGSHNHYLSTGANVGQTKFDPGDFTELATTVEHHGFTRAAGYQIVFLMNPVDAAASVQAFRRGVAFVSGGAATVESLYDFIPSAGQNLNFQLPPGFTLVGGPPANTFAGLEVTGSWGQYLIVQDYQIPAGYMAAVAMRGQSVNANIIGIRESANPAARGVVLRGGNNNNYPLIDSYFIRGMGTGVAQRGGAALMKLDAAGGAYTVPASMAW